MTADTDEAIRTIKRFFFAIAIGDGPAVWQELGQRARAFVLNLAVQQGMDFDLGSRLRNDTASAAEVTDYQANLTWGIQRDLDGIDLSNLVYEAQDEGDGHIRVHYGVPLGLALSGRRGGEDDAAPSIPAGSALLSMEVGAWRVDRLIPRPGG